MKRVVITGMGAISPVGIGMTESWQALLEGKSGAGPITLFDTEAFAVKIACEVKGWEPLKYLPKKKLKEFDRFTEFALVAAQMAVADAGLELTDEEKERAGCFIGVGLGGLYQIEKIKETLMTKGPKRVSPYTIPAIIANLAAGQVSMAHGLKGPSYATTSACASGAHGLGEAAEWIRRGKADVMVAGGAEATISPIGIGGFQAMYALSKRNDSPETASRPFAPGRDGFVCGEGAAVLVLESYERAKARGANIVAELTGYGASSDAYHLTKPAEDGEGAQRAMRMALEDAGITPKDIGYINAHGTSTPVGDKQEAIAISKVFGGKGESPLVSSTKSMTGHLLGAAGALEAVFSIQAMNRGVIPPTINLDEVDPDLDLVDFVGTQPKEVGAMKHVMSNSFGFGGTNATLVFSQCE